MIVVVVAVVAAVVVFVSMLVVVVVVVVAVVTVAVLVEVAAAVGAVEPSHSYRTCNLRELIRSVWEGLFLLKYVVPLYVLSPLYE